MRIAEELQVSKPLLPGHELALALLVTKEHLGRVTEERVFRPAGLTDQQFNLLRILKGGPAEGYTIGELRSRMITRSADVPRLVDRLAALGLARRQPSPRDRRACHVRLTPEGETSLARVSAVHNGVLAELEALLGPEDRTRLLALLEQVREGLRAMAGEEA